ncbi:MAG: hypothetical protein A2X48_07585 [Lentisphaerae bacterium GWF2_49_21]|nr:MAG: hypothetical protein A2X48_07585 [Lentisphaerae bacterium GWF2_49_21]
MKGSKNLSSDYKFLGLFMVAYVVAAFASDPGLIISPPLALYAFIRFPGGLFADLEPKYSSDNYDYIIYAYVIYAILFMLGALISNKKNIRWIILIIFILALLLNIRGCYIQHEKFKSMF